MLMPFAFCSLEHIIVYILLCLCFVLIVVNQMQRIGQMDLDFRTIPKLMEFEEHLGLLPLECLNVKEQLGLMPLECLKLKDEY